MKKIKKRKRIFSPIARLCLERRAGRSQYENLSLIGIAIDRAKMRLEEEKHPGYIDALIKMFDDMIERE